MEEMSGEIRISVIITAYNVEKYIDRSICSVISQTFKPFEIIVVDDGSTDNTAKIVERYKDKVKYYYKPNGGASDARNYGIEKASGDWIAFLDSDDEWIDTHLENFVKKISHKKELMWYGAPVRAFHEDSKELIFEFKSRKKNKDYVNGIYFKDYMSAYPPRAFFATTTIIIKKNVFDVTGMFDTSLKTGEDLDIFFRIGLLFPEIGYSTEIAANKYERTDSLSGLNKWNPENTIERIAKRENIAINLGESYGKRAEPRIIFWVERLIKAAIRHNDINTLNKIKNIYYKRLSLPYKIVLLTVTSFPFSIKMLNKI